MIVSPSSQLGPAEVTTAAAPPPPPPPPEPLFYWQGEIPVFGVIDSKKTIAAIREMGIPVCFLLGNVKPKTTTTAGATTTTPKSVGLFRMLDTEFGYSISEVPLATLDIAGEVESLAHVKLPNIPWTLVEELDQFFRAAHDKYGTESVVMLTFDRTKFDTDNEGEGWGYFVPEQENTPSDCKYQMDEIIEYLDEHPDLMLAGSAHSHPEMSAFASGTDHKDQADFPGIHITYGWKKSSKTTEYHVECRINEKNWSMDPNNFFDAPPKPQLDLTLNEALDKVSKKVYVTAHTSNVVSRTTVGGGSKSTTSYTSPTNSGPIPRNPVLHMPSGSPSVESNVVIARMSRTDEACWFCRVPTTGKMFDHRRCYRCGSFFMVDEDDNINDLIQARNDLKLPDVPSIDPDRANVSIYVWKSIPNADSTSFEDVFECILELDEAGKETAKK